MWAALLLVVAATSSLGAARLVYPDRPDIAVLSGPAFLAAIWTLILGVAVSRGLTLQVIWTPFWSGVCVAAIAGIYMAKRYHAPALLVVPAAASLILMAPYVTHGFASFCVLAASDGRGGKGSSRYRWS